ncbi:carbohydrate-binding family V/XII [Pseudomonas cavernae]|uniref:Carbohydrate-binding family V/XII n=1 Tax=Pseudomonas cavernae TaxID=2320867 RepID=A0A385Z6U7_9PSED|nr:carbohydrate-binding family V/XII [Pseudomonas cavernae]AYC34876.1 carbohydrate-binding family V/XII [Pseudomonas cavernae]
MPSRHPLYCLPLLFCLLLGLPPTYAAQPQTAPAPSPATLQWPRDFTAGEQHIQIYQPQIEDWDGTHMAGRAAIAVGAPKAAPTYGVAHFSATADIDKSSGLVQLSEIKIDKVEVPTAPDSAEQIGQALSAQLPANGLTVPLDQLQASYVVAQQLDKVKQAQVKNDVPQILFANTPSVLVLIDGTPRWQAVEGSAFERVLNSRALILRDADGNCYLQAAGYWYLARDLEGSWLVLSQPPQSLLAVAKQAIATAKPDPLLPADGKQAAQAPSIVLASQPSELIITSGAAQLSPVAGVGLLTLANADHAVFVDPASNTYYVLISGRWFSAPGDQGPWRYVPGKELPADFAKISPEDPKANVLVSVPDTPQAKEAAIAANIPQTASVSRSQARLTVDYDGTPQFAPITGTALSYAVNTATPVLELAPNQFYAVANGVWFVAPTPTGAWQVATQVPAAIYAIPASSPLYYVTYVHIYSVTPTTVVVGYTPGYLGVVVSPNGTVVYGTGYSYAPYVGSVYYGYPPTYGYGAGFALGTVEGFAFGFAAGAIWGSASPWWGPYWWGPHPYYGWSYTNINRANFYGRWGQGTVSHAYGWNAWTGTQWQGSAASGFNPRTGAHFQGSQGGAFNPYSGNFAAGRQGSFVNPATGREGAARGGVVGNQYTGDYAAGRQRVGYNAQTGRAGAAEIGVSGNVQTGERTVTSKGAVVNRRTDSAVVWNNGDVYAGHDGNVYQHSQDGGWQKHTSSGWQPVQTNNHVATQLNQQHQARKLGQQRFSQTAHQWNLGGGGHFGGGRLRR